MPMFSIKSPAAVAAGAVMAVALAAPGLASAAIVVASSGPSASAYPVGKKLDDAGAVTLRAGDTITVLDGKGTRVLRGAGTFAVSAAAGTPARSATFAVLTMQRAAQRVRTGAVRTGVGSAPPASPNLWFIDVSRPGKRCLVKGQPVRLWRLDTAAAATYAVAPAAGGAPVAVTFPAGSGVTAWDAVKVPVTDGGRYTITSAGKPLGTVETALLATQPTDAESLAAALIEKGCTAQLDLLSTTMGQQ